MLCGLPWPCASVFGLVVWLLWRVPATCLGVPRVGLQHQGVVAKKGRQVAERIQDLLRGFRGRHFWNMRSILHETGRRTAKQD